MSRARHRGQKTQTGHSSGSSAVGNPQVLKLAQEKKSVGHVLGDDVKPNLGRVGSSGKTQNVKKRG